MLSSLPLQILFFFNGWYDAAFTIAMAALYAWKGSTLPYPDELRPMLGLEVPKSEMDKLFDMWDPDKSGQITMDELHKQLRRRAEIDPSLQPGAAGEIELKVDQRHELRG